MTLLNPTLFAEWIAPHSLDWYDQIGKFQGTYLYPWNSTIIKPNGESIFDEEVINLVSHKKVLDVGCGHGEFAIHCSSIAQEVVGFDVTNHFIGYGEMNKPKNVSFVLGSTKQGFPFKENEFDCAYIRKGPTSGYPALKHIVKKGGIILGLHPGNHEENELSELFPNLFTANLSLDSTEKTIESRLIEANYYEWEIEIISSNELIHSPMDIIRKRCFGQHPTVMEKIIKKDLIEITEIFEANKTNGLSVTNSYYIVRAIV